MINAFKKIKRNSNRDEILNLGLATWPIRIDFKKDLCVICEDLIIIDFSKSEAQDTLVFTQIQKILEDQFKIKTAFIAEEVIPVWDNWKL
jgi:hypothetical protein